MLTTLLPEIICKSFGLFLVQSFCLPVSSISNYFLKCISSFIYDVINCLFYSKLIFSSVFGSSLLKLFHFLYYLFPAVILEYADFIELQNVLKKSCNLVCFLIRIFIKHLRTFCIDENKCYGFGNLVMSID